MLRSSHLLHKLWDEVILKGHVSIEFRFVCEFASTQILPADDGGRGHAQAVPCLSRLLALLVDGAKRLVRPAFVFTCSDLLSPAE